MKKLVLLILSATFLLLFSGCSDSNNEKKEENKILKVGMELAYPPFEMSDKDGNPTGVSVDFAKMIARSMNKELKIENIAWDGLIPSLKTGKVDMIISSMTITKERKKSINFSIPYAKTALAILANKQSGVKSIDDLDQMGKTVAVKKGSTGHIYAQKHLKNANVLVFDKENACVLEVVQGKADGFLYDQLTIYRNNIKHKDTTVALLKPFQKDFEYWGVALRKDDTKLKSQVDEFIKKAKDDGTFDDFAYKYLEDAKKTFDKLNISFFF
ncbi:amino acid ABC transporter, periplasmic amino acid-binding protein [Malaciobacter marinus]|uniref:Amino acid ABC transporter substrate-binding protein n=1 Tax=Malaciobacter marinus TaxID=505249 RepID=A0A347TIY9_9BACT|nr:MULTISPECIES: transporter substrate-binding domain-containing protein [Malaciobacter]AXX86567.1 amino acid ABC transporter, periplasmic amino acid-binding protein [Malaciobacter marinus]PHO12515.1 amino acid ABC transporter substrate-binding protein [Malaciobacter marinus]PHO16408.1 amino acid ABC transporter substrate-binding protein [Malaciobacter marinus]RYA23744.1 amino acid ABC transporter substrate-binding protein [Malaciobacter halophilus]